MPDHHRIHWTDQTGGIHKTRWHQGPAGLMKALATARADAKRLGLEIKKADGITCHGRSFSHPEVAEKPVDGSTHGPGTG